MDIRNFDYGTQPSDSKEGLMAKRSLLTMAKDLYNLYMTLEDTDDLPEWCHYKLATSRKDLSDITDYLTSKVMKHCLDKEMSQEDLRLEIKKSMIDNTLSEGLFDFLSKNKSKTSPYKDEFDISHNANLPYREGNYVNDTIRFINTANNLSLLLRSMINDASYVLDEKVFADVSILKIDLVLRTCIDIKNRIEKNLISKKPQHQVFSARKKPAKKSFFSRFFESYSVKDIKEFSDKIEIILNDTTKYMIRSSDASKEKDVKSIMLYEKDKVNILLNKLKSIINLIQGFMNSYEKRSQFDKNNFRSSN